MWKLYVSGLEWAYQTATEHIEKDMEHRKLYYDRKAHCMDIVVRDIILVCQKVFGTTYKIENRWEITVYIVLEKHDDGMTYKVKKIGDNSEESCKNLHRNMLYPFMSVHEDESDDGARELVNPPSKSLCCSATFLQEAKFGNGISFLDHLKPVITNQVESETQDF